MTQSNTTLLSDIEKFLSSNPVRESRLGRAALGDPSFVRELRGGRAVRPQTEERVRAYMHQQSKALGQEAEHSR